MPHLPILSCQKLIKALAKLGYEEVRQKGSHIRLRCERRKSITVPNHPIIGRGLLKKILRDAELSRENFLNLL